MKSRKENQTVKLLSIKQLFLIVAFCTLTVSCRKTYECKDQNGNVVGEYRTTSKAKAEADCLGCNCTAK